MFDTMTRPETNSAEKPVFADEIAETKMNEAAERRRLGVAMLALVAALGPEDEEDDEDDEEIQGRISLKAFIEACIC